MEQYILEVFDQSDTQIELYPNAQEKYGIFVDLGLIRGSGSLSVLVLTIL